MGRPTVLKIHDLHLAATCPDLLSECVPYALEYKDSLVSVWPEKRTKAGWAEWHIDVHNRITPRKVFITVSQISPGAPVTFEVTNDSDNERQATDVQLAGPDNTGVDATGNNPVR